MLRRGAVANPQVMILPQLLDAFQDCHTRTQDGRDQVGPGTVHKRKDRYGSCENQLCSLDPRVPLVVGDTLSVVPSQLIIESKPRGVLPDLLGNGNYFFRVWHFYPASFTRTTSARPRSKTSAFAISSQSTLKVSSTCSIASRSACLARRACSTATHSRPSGW